MILQFIERAVVSGKFAAPVRVVLASGLVVVLAGAFAGCSSLVREKITPDTTASARLDQTYGEIITPLSEYDLICTEVDAVIIEHAWSIAKGKCMKSKGFAYTATMQDSIGDDREYGAWFLENAKKYGMGFPPSPVDAAYERDAAAGGEAWLAANDACGQEMEQDAEFQATQLSQKEYTDSIVGDVRTEAYRYAREDPAWEAAFRKWEKCLEENGLHAKQDLDAWSSEEGAALAHDRQSLSSKEAIRIAVIEAECNNETQTAQTVANLVASYEAPLIKKTRRH